MFGEASRRGRGTLGFALAALALSSPGCAEPADSDAMTFAATAMDGAIQETFLRWPLPPGAEAYADIDGRGMLEDVVEQAAISRRYRDNVHSKFWGRIIGSSADAESAEWLQQKFQNIGLSDIRIQRLDLPPQWFPQTYQVAVTLGTTRLELESAQPVYRTAGTPADGLELEAVYVGLGSDADFAARDVAGKAVFTYSMSGLPTRASDVLERADAHGAAAIFDVHMMPGNLRNQAYPAATSVPTFTVGNEDGFAVRELIESAPAGQPVRVTVRLDVEMVPDLETAIVWGSLPGASDETIYVIAHRDGFFDASGDNASGVASMIGLAEHYARIPQSERPRTLHFLGIDGHHNSTLGPDGRHLGDISGAGRNWMVEHREELFANTALMINAEHPSTVHTRIVRSDDGRLFPTTTYTGQEWYAGGPSRPELQRITMDAFREFGVSTNVEANPRPPGGDLGRFYTFLPGVATSDFYHFPHRWGDARDGAVDRARSHDEGVRSDHRRGQRARPERAAAARIICTRRKRRAGLLRYHRGHTGRVLAMAAPAGCGAVFRHRRAANTRRRGRAGRDLTPLP